MKNPRVKHFFRVFRLTHYILWSTRTRTTIYSAHVNPVDPTTVALIGLTALNALGWGWNTFRGRDARLRATSGAALALAREACDTVDTLKTQKTGDRLEHARQVEELVGLVADVERVRASAASAVNRRERKERQHVAQEEVPTDRASIIAAARRQLAASG